jgi:hypothetical protein
MTVYKYRLSGLQQMAAEAHVSDLSEFTLNAFREWPAEVPDEVTVHGDRVTLRFTGALTRLSHPEQIVGYHYLGDPRDEALREIVTDVGRQVWLEAGRQEGWPPALPG